MFRSILAVWDVEHTRTRQGRSGALRIACDGAGMNCYVRDRIRKVLWQFSLETSPDHQWFSEALDWQNAVMARLLLIERSLLRPREVLVDVD